MRHHRTGRIAVIFASTRNRTDDAGYAAAAEAMDVLAAAQPGYCGIDSVRDPDGRGITVSYWIDDAAAIAWRDHPCHRATRDEGRARWYSDYSVTVARVERDYDWSGE
ncbi:antibiotic biosynthesis monooxygenase [Sphingomonas bacterium]|uniref:antibiotic biosynthesis monooxygenase family protein n=1 Tax=Sphingomonas bacterium TaxID=1895847 RepID=UPI0015775CD8|nr:antibiotic biosynthesis monooxygenase [Sphingomonas bacterium]